MRTKEAVSYTHLIHVGRNGMACCPFHNDKTPSMKLDRRYHCFGCGADGDVIDFAARLFGLNKKEAALKLAEEDVYKRQAPRPSPTSGYRPAAPTTEQRGTTSQPPAALMKM